MEDRTRQLSELGEAQLLARAQKRDEEAFKEIVRRLEPRVVATVTGMLGPGPEAEDVGQETFVRFYRALDTFRQESSMASYVTRIAINLCQNVRQRRKRRAALFVTMAEDQLTQAPAPKSDVERSDERRLIYRALQELSPEYRAVLTLRIMQGCSTRETAEILNVPEGTVTSRLSRAQMRLREILEPLLKEAS